MYLVVYVLSKFSLLDKISSQSKPRSVSSLVIPDFNEVIVATLMIHIDTVSVDITFFENSSMFPITHPLSSDVISLLIFYPVSDISYVPPTTLPRPLRVYTRRSRTDIESLVDSSPMVPSFTMLVLSSPSNLPIAIRKDTRFPCSPHPIYNFLTYHCLSSPYYAVIFTLFFVSLPKTVSHPGWKQAMFLFPF